MLLLEVDRGLEDEDLNLGEDLGPSYTRIALSRRTFELVLCSCKRCSKLALSDNDRGRIANQIIFETQWLMECLSPKSIAGIITGKRQDSYYCFFAASQGVGIAACAIADI